MTERTGGTKGRTKLKNKDSIPTQLYLPKKLHEDLAVIADELCLTKNAVVTLTLLSFLEQYEENTSYVFAAMGQPKGANDSRLQVHLPFIVKEQLGAIAHEQKQNMNWLANLAINTFTENYIRSGTKILYDILDVRHR